MIVDCRLQSGDIIAILGTCDNRNYVYILTSSGLITRTQTTVLADRSCHV